tara:strand:- start:230 stop:403 length:174 start_codon:yes stop_codon:yes gene_type:complete
MALYKFYKDLDGSNLGVTKDLGNNKSLCILISNNEDNVDYQEYKEWVDAGNTTDPAD